MIKIENIIENLRDDKDLRDESIFNFDGNNVYAVVVGMSEWRYKIRKRKQS